MIDHASGEGGGDVKMMVRRCQNSEYFVDMSAVDYHLNCACTVEERSRMKPIFHKGLEFM